MSQNTGFGPNPVPSMSSRHGPSAPGPADPNSEARQALEDEYLQLLWTKCRIEVNVECRGRVSANKPWERARVRRADGLKEEEIQDLIRRGLARVKLGGDGQVGPRTVKVPMSPDLLSPIATTTTVGASNAVDVNRTVNNDNNTNANIQQGGNAVGPPVVEVPAGETPRTPPSELSRIETLERQVAFLLNTIATTNNSLATVHTQLSTLEVRLSVAEAARAKVEQDFEDFKRTNGSLSIPILVPIDMDVAANAQYNVGEQQQQQQQYPEPATRMESPTSSSATISGPISLPAHAPVPVSHASSATFIAENEPSQAQRPSGTRMPAPIRVPPGLTVRIPQPPVKPVERTHSEEPLVMPAIAPPPGFEAGPSSGSVVTPTAGRGPVYSGKKLVRHDLIHAWGENELKKREAIMEFAARLEGNLPLRAQKYNQGKGYGSSTLVREDEAKSFIEIVRAENPSLWPENPGEVYVAKEAQVIVDKDQNPRPPPIPPTETKPKKAAAPKQAAPKAATPKTASNPRKRLRVDGPSGSDNSRRQFAQSRIPNLVPPKGCNQPFLDLFNRVVPYLSDKPPSPLPGPMSAPEAADGLPWLFYALGGTFQDGLGHSLVDDAGKTIPGSAPRCPIDKGQAELWYRAVLEHGWESAGASYNLGIIIEDRNPYEAERLYTDALRIVEKYPGQPCVFDFEDAGDRAKKILIKKLARVRKKLGIPDEVPEKQPSTTFSGGSDRTLVASSKGKERLSDGEGTADGDASVSAEQEAEGDGMDEAGSVDEREDRAGSVAMTVESADGGGGAGSVATVEDGVSEFELDSELDWTQD